MVHAVAGIWTARDGVTAWAARGGAKTFREHLGGKTTPQKTRMTASAATTAGTDRIDPATRLR
jgi:hypothetical protein